MIHDALCPWLADQEGPCLCELLIKTRKHERAALAGQAMITAALAIRRAALSLEPAQPEVWARLEPVLEAITTIILDVLMPDEEEEADE